MTAVRSGGSTDCDVTVVVVTHNSAADVDGVLRSVPEACRGLTSRVIVVDNGSTDDTADRVRAHPDCELVVQPNRGYAAGINTGARIATPSRAVLVLNADVRLGPGSVTSMMGLLARPDTGVVAPRTLWPDGGLQLSLRRAPTLLRAAGLTRTGLAAFSEYLGDPETYRRSVTVDWALGAALLIDRGCFEAHDGWDESFFLYSEEVDFCLRAQDRGYRVRYDPHAVVVHREGGSGRSWQNASLQALNRVRLYGRRHGAASTWLYWALLTTREAVRAVGGTEDQRTVARAMLRPRLRPVVSRSTDRLLPR